MDQSPLAMFLAERNSPLNPQMAARFEANKAYVRPGEHNYNTNLSPLQEMQFRQWVQQNKVPFDPGAPVADYDMRGFWRSLQMGDPRAVSAVNPNDKRMHYPDHWKTPYHETFSRESQWAQPVAPRWGEGDQLVSPGGRILHDERAPRGFLGR